MRVLPAMMFAFLFLVSPVSAAPQDDLAGRLAGPWGRVDRNWLPLTGALSKNSCPSGGVARPESVGLFGEGAAMWIEPAAGGSLNVYDGSPLPRLFAFVEMSGAAAAVYREAGVERLYTLIASDRLTQDRVPVVAGLPATNFVRCSKKR